MHIIASRTLRQGCARNRAWAVGQCLVYLWPEVSEIVNVSLNSACCSFFMLIKIAYRDVCTASAKGRSYLVKCRSWSSAEEEQSMALA